MTNPLTPPQPATPPRAPRSRLIALGAFAGGLILFALGAAVGSGGEAEAPEAAPVTTSAPVTTVEATTTTTERPATTTTTERPATTTTTRPSTTTTTVPDQRPGGIGITDCAYVDVSGTSIYVPDSWDEWCRSYLFMEGLYPGGPDDGICTEFWTTSDENLLITIMAEGVTESEAIGMIDYFWNNCR